MEKIRNRGKEAIENRPSREGGRRKEDSYSNTHVLLIVRNKHKQHYTESDAVQKIKCRKISRVVRSVKGTRIFSVLSWGGERSR